MKSKHSILSSTKSKMASIRTNGILVINQQNSYNLQRQIPYSHSCLNEQNSKQIRLQINSKTIS